MRSPYIPAPRRRVLGLEVPESKDVVGSMLDATLLSIGSVELFHIGNWRPFGPAIFRVNGSEQAAGEVTVHKPQWTAPRSIDLTHDADRSLPLRSAPSADLRHSSSDDGSALLPSPKLDMLADFSFAGPQPGHGLHQPVSHPMGMAAAGPMSGSAVGSGGSGTVSKSLSGTPAGAASQVVVPGSPPLFQGTFTPQAAASGAAKQGKNFHSSGPRAPLTPPMASLTVDGLTESQKADPGALVVRNADGNNAPRKKITISAGPPEMVTGVTLTVNNNKVDVFTAATGGTALTFNGTDNDFPIAALPKDLWVEGADGSDTMRDTQLMVEIDNFPQITNGANFTCLWVEQPQINFSGTVSVNNDKRDFYKDYTTAKTYDLGLQTFYHVYPTGVDYRLGWGLEGWAPVDPWNFGYPGATLLWDRDWSHQGFLGSTPIPGDTSTFHGLPNGNDISDPEEQDNNPLPDGFIYDVDAPGIRIFTAAVGTIARERMNFECCASVTINGDAIRASEIRFYNVRISMKETTAPSGSDWQVIDPPDVIGDNSAAYYTPPPDPPLTWDLK